MFLAALVMAVHLDCCREPPQPNDVRTVTTQIERSATDLKRYKATHSFDDLGTAAADMDGTLSFGAVTLANFITYRRTLVSRYAYIISELQKFYDPTFDANDRQNYPVLWKIAPSENSAEWAEYQKDTREFASKKERIDRYTRVWSIDRHAMTGLDATLQWFCDIAPAGMPADTAALNGILDEYHIAGDRRLEIISYYCMRPGPRE